MKVGLVTPWARERLSVEDMDELHGATPADAWVSILAAGRGFQARVITADYFIAEAVATTPIQAFRTAHRNLVDDLGLTA